jgi:hypothetical protein
MFIEVLLVVALPLLGTFVIALLRKVVGGEPLDLRFGNDAALEMIVLSLGGLAGAAHNPRLMASSGAETPTWRSLVFLPIWGWRRGCSICEGSSRPGTGGTCGEGWLWVPSLFSF